jgi:hypothetical protein
MRLPLPLYFIALFLGMTILVDLAGAAPARRKPEVFRAVEGAAEGPQFAADPGDAQAPRARKPAPKPAREVLTMSDAPEVLTTAPAVKVADKPTPVAVAPKASAGYEIVPEKERASFERRLELAERLIMEGNRAYDYRSTTSRELQDALHSLSP